MSDRIKTWIKQELEKGEDPELLRMSLRAQNLDPSMVDKARSEGGYSSSIQIPWKKILPLSLFIVLTVLAYVWINSSGNETTGEGIDSRFNLTLIRGNPETVSLKMDFIQGVRKALQEYGSYNLKTKLQENHCYIVYNDWDSEGNYLGIKELYSPTMNCIGDTINDTKIRTPHFVSIEFKERRGNCICGEREVNIETSETRNLDTGRVTINLKIGKK